jgi:spore coat polysaccharide biosynthesis predicted glycosyltransferase SpsG
MIIVHAKGNSQLGIGNLSRSYELIRYLSVTKDIIGIFECDENIFKRYDVNNIYRVENLNESLELIAKYNSFIYISDLVSPQKELSSFLRENGVKKILHFNEVTSGFEPDILFVTDGFDYEFLDTRFKIYRGFEYYIVGSEILKYREKVFKSKGSIKNILICFGGADPAFFTEYFVEKIDDSKYNYKIVLGPAMPKNRKENILTIKKENIEYIDSPKNMIELLLNSDLLITLGGMTTYEAMCLGVPASAVRWNYLEYIVKSFGEKNMITDLGNIDEAYENLLNLNLDNVNKVCKNAYDIIDGSALKNIKKIIDSIEDEL